MRIVLILIATFILAACIEKPLPDDAVRDADAAIAIAKKETACLITDDPNRRWSAWLHDGVWDVRQYFPGRSGECGWAAVKVRARDGRTDGKCEACVP